MRVPTKEDVIGILKKYDIGKVSNIKKLGGGIINYNFDVKTERGRYIVRFLDNKLDKENLRRLKFKFSVLRYLRKNNFRYKTPLPLKNNLGKLLTSFNKKNAWIYGQIGGKTVSKPNVTQLREMIRALAEYNKLVGKKDWKKKQRSYSWLMDKYSNLKKACGKKKIDKLMLENLVFFETTLRKLLKKPFEKNIIPIHSDFHGGNVLFEGNKIVGIIDFGNLKLEPRAKDVAYLVRTFCLENNKLNKKKMDSILKEYRKTNSFTKQEEAQIIDLMMLYNCVVFWWFYAEMKQKREMAYKWLKDTIETNKNLEELR